MGAVTCSGGVSLRRQGQHFRARHKPVFATTGRRLLVITALRVLVPRMGTGTPPAVCADPGSPRGSSPAGARPARLPRPAPSAEAVVSPGLTCSALRHHLVARLVASRSHTRPTPGAQDRGCLPRELSGFSFYPEGTRKFPEGRLGVGPFSLLGPLQSMAVWASPAPPPGQRVCSALFLESLGGGGTRPG